MWSQLLFLSFGITYVRAKCDVIGKQKLLECIEPNSLQKDLPTVSREQAKGIQQIFIENQLDFEILDSTQLIAQFPNLINLTIKNCGLHSIVGTSLTQLMKIEHIDLSNNQIRNLSWKQVAHGKQLKLLNLSGNPLVCSCNNYWIHKFDVLRTTTSFEGSVVISAVNAKGYNYHCDSTGRGCEGMSVANVVKLPQQLIVDKRPCQMSCASSTVMIESHTKPLSILPDQRLELTCLSPNKTNWRWRNSSTTFSLIPNTSSLIDPLTGQLIIEKSSSLSSGWIICESQNEFIPVVKAVPLMVQDKPVLLNPAAGDRGHHQLSFFIDIFGAESKNLTLTRNGYWLGINENPRLTVITPPSLSDFFLSRWKLTFSQVLHTCAEGQYEVTTCNSYGCDRKSFSIAEGGCKQDDCQSRPSERLLSCVKILELGNIPSRVNDTNSTSPMQSIVEKPVVSAEVLTLGSVAFVFSFLLLCGVSIIASCYCIRHKKLKESSKRYRLEALGLEPLTENSNRPMAPLTETNFNYGKFNRSLLFDGSTPYIDENFLDSVKELGEGAFGRVCLVRLNFGEIVDKEQENLFLHGVLPELMAMKQLKFATPERIDELKNEAKIMLSLNHPNIVSFLGVSSHRGSFCFLFEYMENGDLANYMRDRSPESSHFGGKLSIQQQLNFGIQIANGMKYLADKHYVHRDLAARNCLVGVNERVKISDFGMTRDTYITDYYKMGHQALLPIRWLPPESFLYGRFTVESDVWSCGVVLWEIFTYGRVPWYMYSNVEVLKCISEGQMLEKPDLCPEEIYDLMKRCWKKVPADRISMTQLHHCLSDMLTTMQQLIDYVCLLPSPAGDLKLLPVQNVEENLPLGAVAL